LYCSTFGDAPQGPVGLLAFSVYRYQFEVALFSLYLVAFIKLVSGLLSGYCVFELVALFLIDGNLSKVENHWMDRTQLKNSFETILTN